jgi:hypothetical protein
MAQTRIVFYKSLLLRNEIRSMHGDTYLIDQISSFLGIQYILTRLAIPVTFLYLKVTSGFLPAD